LATNLKASPFPVKLEKPPPKALCVMESIRALARAGHVVACTIHQPRQAIVEPWRHL